MFPIDKTDEWDSMHDPDSMAQPSPLRYVPSITTNGTVIPKMSEMKCRLADIPGHDCAVDPCEPPSVSEISETKIPDWPASTCVKCGKLIPSGTMRRCGIDGEYCSWNVPPALAKHIAAVEAREKELREDIAGFPNLAAMRQAMVDTEDENACLREAIEYIDDAQKCLRDEIKKLESQLAEATKPVTDEEWVTGAEYIENDFMYRSYIDEMLANRAAKGGE